MTSKRKAIDFLNQPQETDTCIEKSFYIGFFKKKMTISKRPVDYIFEYLNCVFSDVVGFIADENYNISSSTEVILCHFVCSILNYNGVDIEHLQFAKINGSTLLLEPAILKKLNDGSFKFYISWPILEDLLINKTNSILHFDHVFEKNDIYANNLDTVFTSMLTSSNKSNNNYNILSDKEKDILYKLFVVADHTATHYLVDNYNVNSIIDHSHLSRCNFNTLHCSVSIKGVVCNFNTNTLEANSNIFAENDVFENDIIMFNEDRKEEEYEFRFE